MWYLIIVSIIWGFSFGLINGNLTGIDSNLVSFLRMFISLVIFLPFLRIKRLPTKFRLKMLLTGMVQYGFMYALYIYSYQFLKAYQIAIFTIFTPFYVSFINDLLTRSFHKRYFFTAFLAVLGTAIVIYQHLGSNALIKGFVLMQVSNLCFASGQIYYRREMRDSPSIKDREVFGLLYLGAVLITGVLSLITVEWGAVTISLRQGMTLLYLGIVASGFCFFLWNYGAKRANAGALAVANNLKIPLAVTFSLLFFGESGDIGRLLVGGWMIITALLINQKYFSKA